MQQTVYNPQKGRLETLDITFTDKTTTWFDAPEDNNGVYMIADFESGLIIADCDYSYPMLLDDVSRADINHDRQRALELRQMYMQT
jgi:hypothetical protein